MSDPNEQHPTPDEIELYELDDAKYADAEMYERREDEGRCPECGYYEYFGEYYCPVCGGDL